MRFGGIPICRLVTSLRYVSYHVQDPKVVLVTLHSGCAEHGKPQHVTHLALRLRRANNGMQATVQNELASEKVFVQGCDIHGRPMFIVFAKQQEQGRPEETKRFICYTLDNVIATADPQKNELGQFLCLFDLSGNHAACLSELPVLHQAQLKRAARVRSLVGHVADEWLFVHICALCPLCLLTCKPLVSKEGRSSSKPRSRRGMHMAWLSRLVPFGGNHAFLCYSCLPSHASFTISTCRTLTSWHMSRECAAVCTIDCGKTPLKCVQAARLQHCSNEVVCSRSQCCSHRYILQVFA